MAVVYLGLTILVRIDGLSDILPVVPFLGVLLAARRRQAVPFGVAPVVGVGYGLADGYLKAGPYLDLITPSLRPLEIIVAVVVVLTLAGLAIVAVIVLSSALAAVTAVRRLLHPHPVTHLAAVAAASRASPAP